MQIFTRQMILNPCYERAYKPAVSMRSNYDFRCNKVEDIDPILGLQMMIVALKSGVAITRALDAVGSSIPGGKGIWLRNVSKALLSGDTWIEAWSAPYVCFDKKDKKSICIFLC